MADKEIKITLDADIKLDEKSIEDQITKIEKKVGRIIPIRLDDAKKTKKDSLQGQLKSLQEMIKKASLKEQEKINNKIFSLKSEIATLTRLEKVAVTSKATANKPTLQNAPAINNKGSKTPTVIQKKAPTLDVDVVLNKKDVEDQIAKLGDGKLIVIPVKLDTKKGQHNYDFRGKNAKVLSEAVPGKFLSVTKAISYLAGDDDETQEKQTDVNKARLKEIENKIKNSPLAEQARMSNEKQALEKKIKDFEGRKKNNERTGPRGTAYHKVIELMEDKNSGLNRNNLTPETLEKFARREEYKDDLQGLHTVSTKGVKENNVEAIIERVLEYGEFKKQLGLEGQKTTEQSLGVLIKHGNELIKFVGTLDAYFLAQKTLLDIKTSSDVGEKGPLQVNFLNEMLKAANGDGGASQLKIFQAPFNYGQKSGAFDVKQLDSEKIIELMTLAYDIREGKKTTEGVELPKLLKGTYELAPITEKKDQKKKREADNLKNGRDKDHGIPQGRYLNNRTLKSYEGLPVEVLEAQVATLSEEDKEIFVAGLWNAKDYSDPKKPKESNTLYRKGAYWDEVRKKFDSFYNDKVFSIDPKGNEGEEETTAEFAQIKQQIDALNKKKEELAQKREEVYSASPERDHNLDRASILRKEREELVQKKENAYRPLKDKKDERTNKKQEFEEVGKRIKQSKEDLSNEDITNARIQNLRLSSGKNYTKQTYSELLDSELKKNTNEKTEYMASARVVIKELEKNYQQINELVSSQIKVIDAESKTLKNNFSKIEKTIVPVIQDIDAQLRPIEDEINSLEKKSALVTGGSKNTAKKDDSGIFEKSFETADGQMHSGLVVGGGFTSQWSKAYRLAEQERATQIIEQFVKNIDKLGDEEARHVLSTTSNLSVQDEIHSSFIDAVEKALPKRLRDIWNTDFSDIGINDRSKEENVAISGQTSRNKIYKQQENFGTILKTLDDFLKLDISKMNKNQKEGYVEGLGGTRTVFSDALKGMWQDQNSSVDATGVPEQLDDSVKMLDAYDKWRRKMLDKLAEVGTPQESQKLVARFTSLTSLDKDVSQMAILSAQRFARLLYAQEYYDKTLSPLLKEVNSKVSPEAKMSPQDFAGRYLPTEAYTQYQASKTVREQFDNRGDKSIDQIVEDFVSIQTYNLKGNPEAVALQKTLKDLLKKNPDGLSGDFLDTLLKQTKIDEATGTPRKMAYWDSENKYHPIKESEKILQGSDIRSFGAPTEDDALNKLGPTVVKSAEEIVKDLEAELDNLKDKLRENKISNADTLELMEGGGFQASPIDYGGAADTGLSPTNMAILEDSKRGAFEGSTAIKRRGREVEKQIKLLNSSVEEDLENLEIELKSVQSLFVKEFNRINPKSKLKNVNKLLETFDNGFESFIITFQDLSDFTLAKSLKMNRSFNGKYKKEDFLKAKDFDRYTTLFNAYEDERNDAYGIAKTAGGVGLIKNREQILITQHKIKESQQQKDTRDVALNRYQSVAKIEAERNKAVEELLKEREAKKISEAAEVTESPVVTKKQTNRARTYVGLLESQRSLESRKYEAEEEQKVLIKNQEGTSEIKREIASLTKELEKVNKRLSEVNIDSLSPEEIVEATKNIPPKKKKDAKPVLATGTEVTAKPSTSMAELIPDVVVEKVAENVIESSVEKTAEAVAETVVKVVAETVAEAVSEVVTEKSAEVVVKKAVEKKVKKNIKKAVEPIPVVVTPKPVPITEPSTGGGETPGNGSGDGTGNGSGDGTGAGEEKKVSRLREYIKLLQQEYSLQTQLYKLEEERRVLQAKQENTAGIIQQMEGIEKTKQAVLEKMSTIGTAGFSEKEQRKIEEEKILISNKGIYDKGVFSSKFDVSAQVKAEKELEGLLNKRLSQEKQVTGAQRTIQVSYSGQEKKALRNVINMTEKEIALLDDKIRLLMKSGLLRKEESDSILRQYQIQQQTNLAQASTSSHGSRNLFDMMKNDVKRAVTRITDLGIAYKFINSIPQGLNKIIQLTKELDISLTNIRVVTGMNRTEVDGLLVSYNKLGKELGATTVEIGNSANEWLRQGYNAQAAGKLITASMHLSKLGMVDSSQATQYLTSALKGFKLEATDAMSIVDKLTKVDMTAAVSAGGIAEALSRTATSAQMAGLDMNQAIGILSTIGEVTQKSMDSVGESVKTLLSRYGNVKAGVFSEMNLEEGGETTDNINDIEKVLGKLGITMRNSSLDIRNVNVVLDELAEKWVTLDTVSKNAVATAFAGVRQRENFNVMMENYDKVKELTEASADSAGTAEEKYKAYSESIEASFKRLSAAWENFTMKLQSSPIIKMAVNGLSLLINNLEKIVLLLGTLATITFMPKIPKMISGFFGVGAAATAGGLTKKDKVGNFFKKGFGFGHKVKEGSNEGAIDPSINKQTTAITSAIGKTTSGLDTLTGIVSSIYKKMPMNAPGGGKNGLHQKLDPLGNPMVDATGQPVMDYGAWDDGVFTPNGAKHGLKEVDGEIKRVNKDGKVLNTKVSQANKDAYRATKEAQPIETPQKKATYRSGVEGRVGASVGTAVMSGVIAGATTDTVSAHGQTVQANAGDKLAVGASSAIFAGLGTAFLGPFGGMIGSVVGAELGKVVTRWLHADELKMKARAAEAKAQLEVLKKIDSGLEQYTALSDKESWNSEDYAEARKYVNELSSILGRNVELQKKFIEGLQKNVEEMKSISIKEVYQKIINGTAQEKKDINHQLELTTLRETKAKSLVTNEELYAKTSKIVNKGFLKGGADTKVNARIRSAEGDVVKQAKEEGIIDVSTDANDNNYTATSILGGSIDAKLKNAQELYDRLSQAGATGEYVDAIRKLRDEYAALNADLKTANQSLIEQDVALGMLLSNIGDLNKEELQSLTLEQAIQKVSAAMEAEGVNVRDFAGVIKDEYLTSITAAIKSNSNLTPVVKKQTQTVSDLINKQEEFNKTNLDYLHLASLLKERTKPNIELFEKLAHSIGMTPEKLEELVYQSNPEHFLDLARALGMTVEELTKMKDVLGNITFGDTLLKPAEVREKYQGYMQFYQDIVTQGSLTQESLEKILADFPELVGKLSDPQALKDFTEKELFGDNNAQDKLYTVSIMGELKNNKDFFKNFKESAGFKKIVSTLPADIQDAFANASKMEDVMSLFPNREDLKTALAEYTKDMSIKFHISPDTTEIDRVIKYQTHLLDEQINNLTEQKETLSQINQEREKGLNLMKAEEALKNAQEEKKRVYRDGIGWTFEADQEAIGSAQKELENLDIQKKQDDLQLEIDKANAEKELLANLPTQEDISSLKSTYEEWLENIKTTNKGQENIITSIDGYYKKLHAITEKELKPGDELKNDFEADNAAQESALKEVKAKFSAAQTAKEEMDNFVKEGGSKNSIKYNNLAASYNSKLQDFKTSSSKATQTGLSNSEITKATGIGDKTYESFLSDVERAFQQLVYQINGVGATGDKTMTFGNMDSSQLVNDTDYTKQFSNEKQTFFKFFNPETQQYDAEWTSLAAYNAGKGKDNPISFLNGKLYNLDKLDPFTLVGNKHRLNRHAYVGTDGKLYHVTAKKEGTLSLGGAGGGIPTLINELGTEAIITPQGTLTALPSKTGIVPADITRNLWNLGEVAPNIIAKLNSLQANKTLGVGNITNNDGTFIDNLTMNVYPTKDYDMNKLLKQARMMTQLTRHSK